MQLKEGDKFVNKYHIERLLGEGGLGRAYLAKNVYLGAHRVIKQLRTRILDEDIQKRFENEAIIGATLNHPNIVVVHDFYKPPLVPTYCIVMEYMVGGSLADWLDEERTLPVVRAVKIIIDVCKGLEAAHRKGIVHRDIKPDNILLSKDRNIVKVGDWGIAHLPTSPLTYVGQILGTFRYMSVEQVCGDNNIDGRSDLYSVGVMLFQMVTGQFYLDWDRYTRSNRIDVIRNAIMTHQPRWPTSYNPDIPPALEASILKALAKDPQDRYQSAAEMIKALQQVLRTSQTSLSVEELIEQARLARQDMKFSTAIKLLRNAKAIAPHKPIIYSQMAALYNLMHHHSAACRVLEEGLKNNPDRATLLRDLGLTYKRMGQSRKAIKALEQSLTLDREQSQIRRLVKTLLQEVS